MSNRTSSRFPCFLILTAGLWIAASAGALERALAGSYEIGFAAGGVDLDGASGPLDFGEDDDVHFLFEGVTDTGLVYGGRLEIVDKTDPGAIDENYVLDWGSFGSFGMPDTEPDPEEPIFVQGQNFGDLQRDYVILFENEVPAEIEFEVIVDYHAEILRSFSLGFGSGLVGGVTVQIWDPETAQPGDLLLSFNCSNFGTFGCLANPTMIVGSLEQTDLSDANDEIFEIRASLFYRFTRDASTRLTLNYSHFNQAFGTIDTAGQHFRYASKDPASFSVWALTPGVSMAPFELPEPVHGAAAALLTLASVGARRRTGSALPAR